MKMQRMALLGLAVLVAGGCEHDKGPFLAPDVPRAYVRWVNAVTDTNATDFKFVDMIEGSPYYAHADFRSISSYQGATAGERHLKVFAVDPEENASKYPREWVVTQVLKDTTITLEAGKYYTLLMTGTARNNHTFINVIQDDRAIAPSDGQIAVHAINASDGMVDIYALASASAPISGDPLFASVQPGKAQPYVLRSTGEFAFGAAAPGTTTSLAAAKAPAGAPPASISESAEGGYSIGGSYLTAFYFPAAVPGSLADGSGPAVVWIQDNAPQQ